MSYYVNQALEFLIRVLFELYTLLFIVLFLLQCVRADLRNPLGIFLITVTNPLLQPLRRLIPGYRSIDFAAAIIMLLLQCAQFFLILLVTKGIVPPPVGLLLLAVASLVRLVVYVYLFCILLQVLLSWLNPQAWSPALELVWMLTAPVLKPIRQRLPPMGGLDLSPAAALILLVLVLYLVYAPLQDTGQRLLL